MARVAKKKVAKKKVTRKKAKKVVKVAKRRGRPPGKKAKKRGRKPGTKMKKASTKVISLPVDTAPGLVYWSQMVVFLNSNKGKNFIVQMDGTDYTLNAT